MNTLRPIIEARELSVAYDDAPILEGVSFDIFPKDFIGVIGPNGGGKTTLMKAILGLLKPMSGYIRHFDTQGRRVDSIEVGYVPQQNAIDKAFPVSVSEVVGYGLMRRGKVRLSSAERLRVQEVIEKVGMSDYLRTPIGELSGGQLQRVLLARAIVATPTLLILDEPNTYVDKHFESQLYSLLPEINNRSAILIVSHDIGSVCRMVKRLFCVNRTVHIHEDIVPSCSECNDSSSLSYLSLLEHK